MPKGPLHGCARPFFFGARTPIGMGPGGLIRYRQASSATCPLPFDRLPAPADARLTPAMRSSVSRRRTPSTIPTSSQPAPMAATPPCGQGHGPCRGGAVRQHRGHHSPREADQPFRRPRPCTKLSSSPKANAWWRCISATAPAGPSMSCATVRPADLARPEHVPGVLYEDEDEPLFIEKMRSVSALTPAPPTPCSSRPGPARSAGTRRSAGCT